MDKLLQSLFCGVMYLTLWIRATRSESLDVCLTEDLDIKCPRDEVIVMESATFGRMEQGRCIRENKFLGCRNDVLFLTDGWCSGRNHCNLEVYDQLEAANTNCQSFLRMYLIVEYHCLKVIVSADDQCNDEPLSLTGQEGTLLSHVTDTTGCGSNKAPWLISAMSGQTIELSIIDFGSEILKHRQNTTNKQPIYGYITDGDMRTTITGDVTRKRHLYTSLSNQIIIEILPRQKRIAEFVIMYKELGCPDLTPPTHAWYKRDGDQAVIGCEWSQKTWHLSCDGHSWSGVVGNCSEPVTTGPTKVELDANMPSVLWLVCLVSISVVLIVVVCVIGVVCIKKYRIKQDVQKSVTLQRVPGQGHYDLDPNIEMASMLYLPYKILEQQQQQQQGTLSDPHRPTSYLIPQDQVVNELTPIRIWERPLPDLPDKPLASSGTTRSGRTPGDGDEAVNNQEDSTIQSQRSDVDTKALSPGHNYSGLSQQMA